MTAVVESRLLTRYYGPRAVVNQVSFAVHPSNVFALLGPNGAGKTTIMKMLLGLVEPTRGGAFLFGCPSTALTPAVRERTGYLAEGHHLYDWMTIGQLARFTAQTHPRWDEKQFQAFSEYFHLASSQRVGTLSNGLRAQASLSLALACQPELLIMDDPTLGLDAGTRQEFLRGIIDLAAHEGRAVIFSSHILSDVERVATRIAIILDGCLRVDVPLDDFKASLARYHLTFSGEVPDLTRIPRVVHRTLLPGEALVTVVRPDANTAEELQRLQPASCERVDMSLEDAFVDYTSGGERKLLFARKAPAGGR